MCNYSDAIYSHYPYLRSKTISISHFYSLFYMEKNLKPNLQRIILKNYLKIITNVKIGDKG